MSDKITPEQLRKEVVAVERMHGETLTVEWRTKQVDQLRAFADALEENARLKSKLIDYAADISNYQDRELSFDAWKQRAERAEAELAKLRQHAEAMAEAIRTDRAKFSHYYAYRADFSEGK